MPSITIPSANSLRRAIAISEQLQTLRSKLENLLTGNRPVIKTKRKQTSPAGLAAIRAAQAKRWRKWRKERRLAKG